ncbi:Protein TPX2 [Capsicum baccatum]|uniref:Protein TPX2 n=1 Tax=Capsicum baccatum TaxID=33114 RepID=A0A2G2UVF6_CAPBA|nr:Protein TPX2 [Capsicum baccatum]
MAYTFFNINAGIYIALNFIVVTSSGSKEEVRPNGNEERATVLKSSGSTEENEERAAVLTSSGIKETARPSGIEERAAELSSSGNKVEVMPNEIEKPAAELASSGSKGVVMPKEIVKESCGSLPDEHVRCYKFRVKSSAELEEEMMAKIPKFKEFHLQTMARANQNAETSTVASIDSTQSHQWKSLHLTAPTSPVLKTSLRGRPPRIRSSKEMEKEELEKVPKFKARPSNKKVTTATHRPF